MTRRAWYAAVFVALVLAAGTGGFGAGDAERGVRAAVVDDDSAYLHVETAAPSRPNGLSRDVTLLTLTNAASTTLDSVTVSVSDATSGAPAVRSVDTPVSLSPGEAGTATADVVCRPDASGPVTLDIEASGDGMAISLHRTVTVTCTGDPNRETAANEGSNGTSTV